jgi:hypothetical protein
MFLSTKKFNKKYRILPTGTPMNQHTIHTLELFWGFLQRLSQAIISKIVSNHFQKNQLEE